MENNKNSVILDVKIDVKEKKFEFLKKWTKCLVHIEAIKCFPCYIKITLITSTELDSRCHDEENTNLILRINIPGCYIQMAKSRTKDYTYGLFWKSNRKDCCIFFALDGEEICKEHLAWLKCSINKLELHRENILLNRRTSRFIKEKDLRYSIDVFDDIDDDAESLKNVKDILEPLPTIPDNSHWSRRISGMSGIYEEIKDLSSARNSGAHRVSRASGIYEEMKPFPNAASIIQNDTTNEILPPPLPPRKKSTSQFECEIQRSYTNPETESFMKKKYLSVFEIFRRTKKSTNYLGSSKISTATTPTNNDKKRNKSEIIIEKREKYRTNFLGFNLLVNKRNSFSSPDLTKFNHANIKNELNKLSITEFDTYPSTSSDSNTSCDFIQHINLLNNDDNPFYINNNNNINQLNISDNIRPSFNIMSSDCNLSKINLVGSNYENDNLNLSINDTEIIKPTKELEIFSLKDDDFSGYCVMDTKATNKLKLKKKVQHQQQQKEIEQEKYKRSNDTEKHPVDDNLKLVTIERCFDIKFRFDDILLTDIKKVENDKKPIYENISLMHQEELKQPEIQLNKKTDYNTIKEEHYVNMMNLKKNHNICSNNDDTNGQNLNENEIRENQLDEENLNKNRNQNKLIINTFDEKVPSYYPNITPPPQTVTTTNTLTSPSQISNKINKKLNTTTAVTAKNVNYINIKNENVYISTPKMIRKNKFDNNSKETSTSKKIFNSIKKEKPNIYYINNHDNNLTINKTETELTKTVIPTSTSTTTTPTSTLLTEQDTINTNYNQNQHQNKQQQTSQRIYQKYATLTRTPNKYIEKSKEKKLDITSVKKFTTLPRFKNIDFSPLKLKINNVLQRHNSDI